jgi:hypothetical protein
VSRFPEGKGFAFTVFDDTDGSTLDNVGPVYRFLSDLGILTTKSVWPLEKSPRGRISGATLQEKEYLDFVLGLQKEGFEIGLHNVRNDDAPRDVVCAGLKKFNELLGSYPKTHCNHDVNRENLYWGPGRFRSSSIRLGYNLATRFSYRQSFEGQLQNSPYFWGDLCQKYIRYVRNFVFDEINMDRVNPTLPYHDPSKPLVNFWFSSTDGGNVDCFNKALCEANQDRLADEGGVCIMYTHFSAGFWQNNGLHPVFKRLMHRLVKLNGWFVPVARLLDYLVTTRSNHVIPRRELSSMERHWLLAKLRTGTT